MRCALQANERQTAEHEAVKTGVCQLSQRFLALLLLAAAELGWRRARSPTQLVMTARQPYGGGGGTGR